MNQNTLYPVARPDVLRYALSTGEFRPPKKGEWYLSGATVEAYYAPNDLSTPYHIARLVERKTGQRCDACRMEVVGRDRAKAVASILINNGRGFDYRPQPDDRHEFGVAHEDGGALQQTISAAYA